MLHPTIESCRLSRQSYSTRARSRYLTYSPSTLQDHSLAMHREHLRPDQTERPSLSERDNGHTHDKGPEVLFFLVDMRTVWVSGKER